VEPGPDGGGDQPHLGVGQDPVTAERAAEQTGRHDGHALGVQAAAMDVGAVDAHQGVGWGHCCIWRPLKPASSTRVPERHRQWQRLTALSTSGSRTDGKRLHFATRQPHHRARCNSAIEAAGELRAAIADNKGQPSSLWMRKFDPQLTGAAGTTPCVRRASVFECCWESAGVLLPAAFIRFLKACVSLSTHSVRWRR
jgi:hypothetical protein